jgi:hypothetical protein
MAGNNVGGSGSVISQFTQTYTTFSGVDITALFDDMTVMTVQGIAVSITREKVPVYVFGRARPVSISRGKRGIAGTLQFVLFDRDALHHLMVDADHQYYAHADEVNWLQNAQNMANYQGSTGTADQINAAGETRQVPVGVARSQRTIPDYMDQIWPFDVTLVAQNEYAQGAWSAIIGLEIINEGGGISMDDLTNEEQATYIAIHRVPWTALSAVDRDQGNSDYWISQVQLNTQGKLGVFGGNPGEAGEFIPSNYSEDPSVYSPWTTQPEGVTAT